MLAMPTSNVYVYYEDGKRENVAIQDDLDKNDAYEFKVLYEKVRRKFVIMVTLETRNGDTLSRFVF